jgi:thioredoxin 1
MGFVTVFDGKTLEETVAGASLPVVVDFWAEWCGPCRAVAPVVDELAAEHSDKLIFAKLNVDEHPDVAKRYEVLSIPTLIVFRDGMQAQRIVGAKPKAALAAELGLTAPTGKEV